MKVIDLLQTLDARHTHTIQVNLGDIQVAEDAATLQVYDEQFPLDDLAENALANYLGINPAYLKKCPNDLKAMNFRYWLDHKSNALATLEASEDNLLGIHRPDAMLLPLRRVYEIVSRVFQPEDDVRDLRRDTERVHLDVTTDRHAIVVPNPDGLPNRPAVGDITAGGVRILAHPNEAKAPTVQSYLHRLICANGMTTPESQGTIKIKGRTVPEVLQEMEEVAHQVLSTLDDKLADYAAMAHRPIPGGNPTSFAYQVGREAGLGQRVMDRIVQRANLLPADNATLYDVQQIFTEVANAGVSYSTMTRLQTVGGSMAFDTERVLHRCGACERLLPN